MPFGTLITRNVVPNMPAYTVKNGAVCYSPDDPAKLSLSAQMNWHCEFVSDIPFFAELPQNYETEFSRYTYSWVHTPPSACTAARLNQDIASLIHGDTFRYSELDTTDTTSGHHFRAFSVSGGWQYDADDHISYDFDFSLMWDNTLSYWEWYSPAGSFGWSWEYLETETDKRTGSVSTRTQYANAEASYTMPLPSQWVQTYSTAARFTQDHPNDELRLGDGLLLVPVNMANRFDPVTGDVNNYQGSAFNRTAISLSATWA